MRHLALSSLPALALLLPSLAAAQPAPADFSARLAACQAENKAACVLAGVQLLDGRGVARDEARGAQLIARACELGDATGCGMLGALHIQARGVPRDFARAAGLLQRGCDGGFAAACAVLGRMYHHGVAVPRDEARARDYFQRGCTGGDRTACTDLQASSSGATVTQFEAPPPVTGTGSAFAPPPPVVAPPPVAAPARPVVVRATSPRPVRMIVAAPVTPPPTVRVTPRASPSSDRRAPAVGFLGAGIKHGGLRLGYEFSLSGNAAPVFYGAATLSMVYASEALEFSLDLRYGGGHSADAAGRANDWSSLIAGASLGLNLLSFPNAARSTWSLVNLATGATAHYAFADTGASDGRVGVYAANTTFFSCNFALRVEYTYPFAGDDAFPATLGVLFEAGGGSRARCR